MISQNFYNKKNLIKVYLNGKVSHFAIKDASVTLEWCNYVMKADETIYSLAEKLFGDGLAFMWTYIADNNIPRMPDDWKAGDIIKIPKVIIRDSDSIKTLYADV